MGPWRHGDGCRSPDDTSDAAQPNVATSELGRTHRPRAYSISPRLCSMSTSCAAAPSSQKSSISCWRSSFLGCGWTVDSSEGHWRSLRKMDVGWHSDMGSSSWIRKDERSWSSESRRKNEPHFEVYPEDEEEKDENNAKEGQEEAAGEEKDGEDPMEVWAEEDEGKKKEGGRKKGMPWSQGELRLSHPISCLHLKRKKKKSSNLEASTSRSSAWLHLWSPKLQEKSPRRQWTSSPSSEWTASTLEEYIQIEVMSSPGFSGNGPNSADTHTWRWSSSEWPCGGAQSLQKSLIQEIP